MQIKYYKLNELTPYANNPRKNDNAVDAVAESIKEFGFKVPIIIDKNNVIVAGHTRLKAAEKLGLETIPTILADDLTDEQIKAFRLADNKTAELAGWDFEKLDEELEKIKDVDMSRVGFDGLEKLDISEFMEESENGKGGSQKPQLVTCSHCGTIFDAHSLKIIEEGIIEN